MLLLLFGGGSTPPGNVYPSAATATATAYDATVAVSVAAGQAAATGTAYDATVASGTISVNASAATATATAYDATVRVKPLAATATGVGAANDALSGVQVSSPADLRRVVLVDVNGTTIAELGSAQLLTWAPGVNGDHDQATFRLPVTSTDVALIAGTSGVRFRKVQLWRGDVLLLFGTIVDWTLADGWVEFTVMGPSWDLAGVRVGPVTPTNHLTNASFEDGFTGWRFAKTVSPFTFTTYTLRDARHDVLPAEEVCLVAVGGVLGFDGSTALRLNGSTGTDLYGDLFAWQELAISGGNQGRRVTLSARVWLSTSLFTRYPAFNRGLMLARFPTTFDQTGANGGKDGWWDEMIEWQSTRIDDDMPTDRWVDQAVSIDIPPGVSEILHVRLCAPNGLIYYDSLRLDLQDRLESYQAGAASIVSTLVAHGQDPTYDKVDLNIDVLSVGGTGPLRDLVAEHADRAAVWDLITEVSRYDDGVDVRCRYTPTRRYVEVCYPRAGTTRTDRPLWSGGAVARIEAMSGNGGGAYNAVAVRSDNTEATEWAEATETSVYADSQVRELVGTASVDARKNDLDADAVELLAASVDPTTATVAIHPDWLAEYLDLRPGDWCPTNLTVGELDLVGTLRVARMSLDADDVLRLELGTRDAP